MITKRVYELEVGDVFVRWGREYIVKEIDDKNIYYRPITWKEKFVYRIEYFGKNNQSKIEMSPRLSMPETIKEENKFALYNGMELDDIFKDLEI